MKRIHTDTISFILLILFVLYISCGCTRSRAEDDYFLTRERETDVITTQSLSGEVDEFGCNSENAVPCVCTRAANMCRS